MSSAIEGTTAEPAMVRTMDQRLLGWWQDYGAYLLAAIFAGVFTCLPILQFHAFRTLGLDFAELDQAIWNTLRGRFLYSTFHHFTVFSNHFSPIMALFAPLYAIWSDIRLLHVEQAIGLAAAGLILYKAVRSRHPSLAPWFLLAFYLNPALHEMALKEFRPVVVAVPFVALASYGLYVHKRWLMLLGLVLAMMCKENLFLVAGMFGVYLILFERDWKWGAPLAVIGWVGAFALTFWLLPTLFPGWPDQTVYEQMDYLGIPGETYGEIWQNLIRSPWTPLLRLVDRDALRALWRIFLPLGLVLPFLASDWVLIGLPSIGYMLMAGNWGMHQLRGWYPASFLPALFMSVGAALTRRDRLWARWLTVGLLCGTILGYVLYSPAPLGGKYDPSLYRVTLRDHLSAQVVAAVPPGGRVAAQDPYITHLSQREFVYLYPWIRIGAENVEYFVLDRHANPYPSSPSEINEAIDNMLADPSFVVEREADGIYLFHQRGEHLPAIPVQKVAGGSMMLDRVEVAARDEQGFYQSTDGEPIELQRGGQVRISLYWEALAPPTAERTVSVRIADAHGALIAIQDNQPGQGNKPTSWWQTGWQIRDVYYLTVSPDAGSGQASLDVLVYDSHSLEMVPFADGREVIQLCVLNLVQ
jgi:uncharacterized membrane protein